MPRKTQSTESALDATIEKLLNLGSKSGSVTEDEIQVALKDVDVTDAQLSSIYQSSAIAASRSSLPPKTMSPSWLWTMTTTTL